MLEDKKSHYKNQINRFQKLLTHIENFEKLLDYPIPSEDSVYQMLLQAKEEIPKRIARNEIYEDKSKMLPEILRLIESIEKRKMKETNYKELYGKSMDDFILYLEDKFKLPF